MSETKTAVVNSAQPVAFVTGSGVWIPDPTLEWVAAEVVSDNNGEPNITVTNEEGEEVQAPRAKVYLKNPEILEGSDDLAALSYMSEPHILHNLHNRYNLNMIYTYIGKILIAVNPYARIPLYGTDMINAYYGKPIGALSPHVYAIAEDAFKDMRIEGASQSILVSGESGAGKTETTKYILQYFAAMGGLLRQAGASDAGAEESKQASIEERVLESTPLLEAVGNAKTLRNDNSSRFGKFIEIHFNEHGNIIGAKILTYLLEKSRIVRQVKGERNYHIFYQLLAGATDELREELNLLPAEEYYYLSQSECTTVDEVDDSDVFERTVHAMRVSGMSDEVLRDCWTLVAAILWLGNIKFEAKGEGAAVEDQTPLETTAKILKCSKNDLEQSLITKKISTKTESYNVPLNPDQAENARDTLAMLLYSQLFEFLVSQINNALVTKKKPKSFIGILDIYGFECFEKNGFEQFCINFANEKLQQLFNLHVFKEEQQEYIKEKIDWSYVDFADNQDTLDLIEKKPLCILTLLDEESTFPKSTHLTFATKLFSKLQHPRFEKPRFSNSAFTISHYAGKVTYDTEGFLEKNKDYIIPEQLALLQKSEFPFVKSLIKVIAQQQQGSAGTKFTSVGAQFATSLGVLMKTIMSTSPHYIRCIKPNPTKEPSLFIKKDVMHQLRCGGVMESVRICCAGFPTRRPLDKFYERYKILAPRKKSKDTKQLVLGIVNHLKLDEDKFKIGTTKIFLRSGQLASLEDFRTERLEESATMIQKHFRGMANRKYYLQLRRSSVKIQTAIRKMQARRLLVGLRRSHAALRIQTCFRAFIKRKSYQRTKRLATRLQLSILSWEAKRQLSVYQHEAACITLQTFIRACSCRSKLYKKRRGIALIQARWRGKLARRVYTQLRIEARSLATIQDAKNKLEAKLDEAQWRLQAERSAKSKLETELDELKAATEATQSDKKKLEQEKKAFEHQLKEQEVKFSNEISEKNRILEEQKARLDQELKAGKEEMQKLIERLRAENRDLHAREAQARELIEKLESEKSAANRHVEELTAALQKLKDDHKDFVARTRESEAEKNEDYDKLRADMDELRSKSAEAEQQFRTSRSDMEQRLTESTSGASAKSEEVEKLNTTIETLETELAKLKEAHEKLEESNAEYVSSIGKLKTSEAELDEQLKATKSQMAQEIATRDSALARKSQDSGELEESVKKLKNSLADTEREVQKHLQEINRLSDSSRRDVEKARDDKEYLEGRLKNEIETLKQEVYNLKDTNMQIRQEKDSQTRTIEESYNRRLAERQERISSLEDQLSGMKEIKQKFEGELSREKSQESLYFKEMSALQEVMLKKHQDELDEKRKLSERLQDERDQLREQLGLNKLDLQRSMDAQAMLENAKKEATEKAKEKKEAAAHLKEKVSQQQTEISRLQLDNSQLMQRLETLRSDLEAKIEKAKKKAKKAKAETSGNEKEYMTMKAQNMLLEEQSTSAHAKLQTLEALVQASQREAETKAALLEEANRQINLLNQELGTIQLSLSGELRPSSPSSSSPSSSFSPSPSLSRSGSLAAPSSPPTSVTSTSQHASSAASVKQALEKKEAEYQALLKAQTAKLAEEVSEWEKRVQKVREEKEVENERLKKELEMWRERGLEAERKRYANFLVPPGLLITPFRAAYEESNKQREIMLKQSESKIAKWKIIEQAANFRETEWEKLARNVGSGEHETNMLTKFLLSCAENSLFPGHMLFHHIYYWRAIEMSNVPLLNAVSQTLHETLEMRQENLEEMSQLLACIGFLLYILYKSTNRNMDDIVKVPPLRADQHITLSPKLERSPRPHITTGSDFVEFLKVVVGKTFSCILRILAKRMSTVLEGLFLMESYKSLKTTKNSTQTPLGVTEITTLLSDSAISLFQQAFISTTFSQQIFSKIFRYISGYLLNGILLRQQFCCESFGVFLAPKIEALEKWAERDAIWVGDAFQELGPVRQAAAVLQLKDKSVLVDEKNRRNICPTISPTQLRQLLAMYSPEEYGKKIPINVINSIPIPKTSQEQILTELSEVSGFAVTSIHYLEVSDTFQLPIPFALKTAIEKVCIAEEDLDGTL